MLRDHFENMQIIVAHRALPSVLLIAVHTAILALLAALLPILLLGLAMLIQKCRHDPLHGPQCGNDYRHMH